MPQTEQIRQVRATHRTNSTMAVDPRHYRYHQRRHHLKDFDRKSKTLLSESDRKYLYGVLKDYQTHRQVELLVTSLHVALDTPEKMTLFTDIRHFLPAVHLRHYDRLAMRYNHPSTSTGTTSLTVEMAGGAAVGSDVTSTTYGSMSQMCVPRPVRGESRAGGGMVNGTMSLGRRAHGPRSVTSTSATTSPKLIRHVPQNSVGHTIVSGGLDMEEQGPVKTVFLIRDVDDNLGFSVRGGSEHGLGIYISEITDGSAADLAGLHPGDHILEVNSIRFENIASSSAVKVLTGTTRLRITIRRAGKIPGFKFAREKTSWYDMNEGQMVEGTLEDHGTFHYPVGLAFVDGVIERRIHLTITKDDQYLGFNIRGGSEYGLGVYVSKVDLGGLAEQKGLKVGDQITAVNGHSFENVTHRAAVELMRQHKTLVLTVREVGKYPAFKEIYAEYSWIDTGTGSVTRSRSGLITSVPVTSSPMELNPSIQYCSRDTLGDIIDGLSDVASNRSRINGAIFDYVSDDAGSNEEQVREMTFPDDACLTVRLTSDSPTTSDDRESDTDIVIRAFDTMLLPHSQDVILQERVPVKEEDSENGKGKEKEKRKEKGAPRSQLGVFALQLENMPEEMKKLSKSDRDRIQSLRKPGEINPRQFEDIELNVKKTRTFREMLFGTKSRAKMKGQVAIAPRSKSKMRQPLTNLGFTDGSTLSCVSGALDLNLKEDQTPRPATFVRGLGSQMMLQSEAVSSPSAASRVVERACELLAEDEVVAVSRHLARYEAQGNIEALVTPLLSIFDSPEKLSILSDVRGIIKPADIGRFDSMVSRNGFDAYEEFVAKRETTSLIEKKENDLIPSNIPSKKTLIASVPDSQGIVVKLKKHESKSHQDKLVQVEGMNSKHVGTMQHQKQAPTLPHLANYNHTSTVMPQPPQLRPVQDLLKVKGNSKVYKAIKGDQKGNSVSAMKDVLERRGASGGSNCMEVITATTTETFSGIDRSHRLAGIGLESQNGGIQSLHTGGHGTSASSSSTDHRRNTYNVDVYTHSACSSLQSSRRSSVSSSEAHAGEYSFTEPTREEIELLSAGDVMHQAMYTVDHMGPPRSSSCRGHYGHHVSEVSRYWTAAQGKAENGVVLLSKNSSKKDDSLQLALDMLDGLPDDDNDSTSPQISPRSVTSISTTTSTRFGSYDIHPELDLETDTEADTQVEPANIDGCGSPRNPPIFVPPPPPSDPPPAGWNNSKNDEDDEVEGWSEWVTDDVTDEVMNSSSVGLEISTTLAVMRDIAVGQTPSDSPNDSRHNSSINSSEKATEKCNANYNNNSSDNLNIVTWEEDVASTTSSTLADYFSGSQNEPTSLILQDPSPISHNVNSPVIHSRDVVGMPKNTSTSSRLPGMKNNTQENQPAQVNSLRDTLRTRRKSLERPRVTADAFTFPEHLLVPDWGRLQAVTVTQEADSQQEEVVLTHQTVEYHASSQSATPSPLTLGASDPVAQGVVDTYRRNRHSGAGDCGNGSIDIMSSHGDVVEVAVEYCPPAREPPQSPTKHDHIQESVHNSLSSIGQHDPTLHRNPRGGYLEEGGRHTLSGVSPAMDETCVSLEDVETFMTRPETRGDLYIWQQQALESVIHATQEEEEEEEEDGQRQDEPVLIILHKSSTSLGMSISGGRNSRTQPEVKIEKIFPGGAAAQTGTLKAGMMLVSVDGRSLAHVTHPQAVEVIRRSYANKKHPEMELLVLP